jgi:serine/threonine protein kinase
MKLCPKCQKQYSDDANFCPVDAARLVALEEAGGQAGAASPPVGEGTLGGRFQLAGRLGGGQTGVVHRATDVTTGQAAAVKVIAPAVVALPGLAPRLERELKQLERVHSAGVAKVLASGKRGDDSWVALELLDGAQTLADAIAARGPISADAAAHLIEVVGEALIEAAQVGVVHRDLAPKNVLFAGNDIKLINFSLPVPPRDAERPIAGVAEFTAPEQHDGKPVDQRSNLYSLGALYYFVLTGQAVQHDEAGAVKPPSTLAAVPGAVEAIIVRALDKSPTKRFLTVRQFVDEVGRVARSEADGKPDGQSSAPLGRAKPKAELVQTLLGIRAISSTPTLPGVAAQSAPVSAPVSAPIEVPQSPVAGVISGPVGQPISEPVPMPSVMMSPSVANPIPPPAASAPVDRSPWAAPQVAGMPALAMPGGEPATSTINTQPDLKPVPAVTMATLAPAAPVVPEPLPAPMMPGKKASDAKADDRGKFRETLWFKKGELDAAAAAANEGKDSAPDKADSLPLDERYKDDGSLSRSDKEKYSLRTGGTAMHNAIREGRESGAKPSLKVSEDALIDEMRGGRGKIVAAIVVGVVVLAVILFLIAR